MSLIRSRNTIRISNTDWINGYIVSKIKAGENVTLDVEQHSSFGEQIVISANKTQGRNAIILNSDGVVDPNTYLVLVDASKNPVKVILPVAHDYLGQLSIVCMDASCGIELIPNASTQNVIFDSSNIHFNAKGDSITLISDRGQSAPLPPSVMEDDQPDDLSVQCPVNLMYPGTWYVIGRYTAQWYA